MIKEKIDISNLDSGMEMLLLTLDLIGDERDEFNVPVAGVMYKLFETA